MTKHSFLRSSSILATLTLAALGVLAPALAPSTVHAQRQAPAVEAPASAEGVVNIQTASAEELQRLPGIGPSKAAAIIAFRERTAFRRVEDILRVRGIGRATFRRLRPYLTVSGQTTLTQDVAGRRAPRGSTGDDTGEEPSQE